MSTPRPSFGEAFRFWLKLGFISFGGPAGQIAIMHEFLVEKKKWISDSRFLHGLNYCMLLPGPEAQQLATYIGWLLHGVKGGVVAGLLFILPSLFILLGLSIVYVTFGKLAWVASLFYALKPAVIAIILLALIKLGKRSLLSPLHYAIAFLSFCLIFFWNVSFPLIIISVVVIALAIQQWMPDILKPATSSSKQAVDEAAYFLNKFSPAVTDGLSIKTMLTRTVTGILLWLTPLFVFYFVFIDHAFWTRLSIFFTKSAFVTFGGAYAVLPYVAQESVEKFGWLTEYQMLDGLALGETTPGPLIMVLVFVGFMAGYHHGGASLAYGAMGLLTTAFYTFLPSFLFIIIGAPWIERTKENEKLKAALSVITAAVVGVIVNLTIYFGKAVLFHRGVQHPDWFATIWLLISFIFLHRLKVNMIYWILISAGAGLCYYFLETSSFL